MALGACTSPFGPVQFGVCFSSEQSKPKADEIRSFLLQELSKRKLHVKDHSNEFRSLEENISLVFLDAQDRRILPSYKVAIKINLSRGGSNLVLYSADSQRPEKVLSLIKALEHNFGFATHEPNDHGECVA